MQHAKIRNSPVSRAVKLLGGLTKTANAMLVSGQAVNDWRQRGFVPTREHAIRLAELTGIPAACLMGLPTAPGGNGRHKQAVRAVRNGRSDQASLPCHGDGSSTRACIWRAA